MNIFLDTSSLFKLYHREKGTVELENLFSSHNIEGIYLAEIAKIEFASVVSKKARMKEMDIEKARFLLSAFEIDQPKFSFVPDSESIKSTAVNLISKHWMAGLRTLDSIQLASVLEVKEKVGLFHTSDMVLKELAKKEGLSVG
jgi:predicted nucleic acid-binding protein